MGSASANRSAPSCSRSSGGWTAPRSRRPAEQGWASTSRRTWWRCREAGSGSEASRGAGARSASPFPLPKRESPPRSPPDHSLRTAFALPKTHRNRITWALALPRRRQAVSVRGGDGRGGEVFLGDHLSMKEAYPVVATKQGVELDIDQLSA